MHRRKENQILGAIFLALAAFSIHWSNSPPELAPVSESPKSQEPIPGQLWCLTDAGNIHLSTDDGEVRIYRILTMLEQPVSLDVSDKIEYGFVDGRGELRVATADLDKFLKSAHSGSCE